MEITIAPMCSDAEIEGKAYVHFKSWQEAYAGLVDAEYLARHTLERAVERARRYPENTLVAKDGERVVGFACYGECRDEGLPNMGEVYALYVLSEHYGKRIGYRLMTAALEQIPQYDTVAVWVLKGNERAIRFYERYGFEFDGAEKTLDMGTPRTVLRMILHR